MKSSRKRAIKAVKKYRLSALFCFYGLLAYYAYTTYEILLRVSLSSLLIWIIQILPLLLFAPGLHLNILRSNIWLSFIVLLYFIHGVLIIFDLKRTILGIVEVSLCVGLFFSLVLLIRALQNMNRQQSPPHSFLH